MKKIIIVCLLLLWGCEKSNSDDTITTEETKMKISISKKEKINEIKFKTENA